VERFSSLYFSYGILLFCVTGSEGPHKICETMETSSYMISNWHSSLGMARSFFISHDNILQADIVYLNNKYNRNRKKMRHIFDSGNISV